MTWALGCNSGAERTQECHLFLNKHKELAPQLELNSRLLPLVVIAVALVKLVDSYRGWTILLVGLGGAWLISYLWARSLAGGLDLTREMRYGWAQVGDTLQERFTLTNTGWAPGLWIEIENHSNLPDIWTHIVRAVGSRDTHRWQSKGICSRRGLFTLGPTSLRTSDPLGIYTVRLRFSGSAELLVTPPIVPLPNIQVAPGGRTGEGRPRPFRLEETVSASSVRDYVAGDSLRSIHWPTSARRGALYVRLFDSLPAGDWWVILDANQEVQAGQDQDSTEEHGVILAASLVDQGVRAGRSVGLVANGREPVWRHPQRGDGQRLAVLHDLALLETGQQPLAELLYRLPQASSRQASLIIVTPDVTGNWPEALFPLMRRGAIPTILLLDPVSFGGHGHPSGIMHDLSRWGIAHTLITRDLLDRPEARPGREGQWEWYTSATGRAIPLQRPSDAAWKELA